MDAIEIVSKLGPLVAALAAGVTSVGVYYVYRQYVRSITWRMGDLAEGLMARLEVDQELSFACHALDWGVGPILVPERYLALMKRFAVSPADVFDHDPSILAIAMKPHLDPAMARSPQGLIYRLCFIKLFNHLDNIARLVETGQIAIKDLDGLDYWLEKLSAYDYAPAGTPASHMFQPAIAAFGYRRIPELARKLGVKNLGTNKPPGDRSI